MPEDDDVENRPGLSPDAGFVGPFEIPQFPPWPFMIMDQNGEQDGPFSSDDFLSDEDGLNVYFTQDEGRPLFLRVLRQEGDSLWSLDGDGATWVYTLVPAQDFPSSGQP